MNDPDHWKWANEVLYRMCRESPTHKEIGVVTGKVWLIGRAYSASIERKAGPNMIRGENFYTTRVAPMIMDSDIDTWLDSTKSISRVTAENMSSVLDVHKKVTDLFKTISGIDKRSLASKYLHFHQPNVFSFSIPSQTKRPGNAATSKTSQPQKAGTMSIPLLL